MPAVPEWSDFDDGHGKDCIFLESTLSVRLNMNGPNNGQNQQQPRPQTKAEIVAQREQVRMLGIALGNWREAARQCGLSEGRVLNWVVRYGWKLPKRIQAPHPREVLSPVVGVVTPAESLEQRLKHDAEATRVGLSTATRKASVSLAEREGNEVVTASARLKVPLAVGSPSRARARLYGGQIPQSGLLTRTATESGSSFAPIKC